MTTTEELNTSRQIPTIRCTFSVSFTDATTAQNFATSVYALVGRKLKIFKPKASNEWIVDVAVLDEQFWYLDEAVSKLFAQIDKDKNQLKKMIIQHHGEVAIDIAAYETETYPALFFSRETVQNICFFSASVGIDLV